MIENIENWREAGRIAGLAREFGRKLIKPGASLLEVSDRVEERINELGGECAFPAQISCDNIAAHYCADADDKITFDKQVASLDVGVHIGGCIGDTACTVDLSGEHTKLVEASKEALKNAIAVVKEGASLGEIGRAIQETISGYGFAPIRNLSGHGLSPYNVHDSPTVPNFDTGDKTVPPKGSVIAIEPFATNGTGLIQDTNYSNIISLVQKKPVRNPFSRELLKIIEKYKGLPLTTRWLYKQMNPVKVNFGLKELLQKNILRDYSPLTEVRHGIVSQAEHTLYIGDEVEVLTDV